MITRTVTLSVIIIVATTSLSLGDTKKGQGMSSRNDWAGAQVAYNFAGTDAFEDNMQVVGQVVLQTWTPPKPIVLFGGELQFPFLGNIANPTSSTSEDALKQKARELAASAEGISFGIAPNLLWGKSGNYNQVAWIYLGWKTNAAKTLDDETLYLDQIRISCGWELLIMSGFESVNDKPGSLSIEFFYYHYDRHEYEQVFGYPKNSLFTLELCFIVPLSDQIGILGNYVINLDYDANSMRLGMILNPPTTGKM